MNKPHHNAPQNNEPTNYSNPHKVDTVGAAIARSSETTPLATPEQLAVLLPSALPSTDMPRLSAYARGWNDGCADWETLHTLEPESTVAKDGEGPRGRDVLADSTLNENTPECESTTSTGREAEQGEAERVRIEAKHEAARLACVLSLHPPEAVVLGSDITDYANGYCEAFEACAGASARMLLEPEGTSAVKAMDEETAGEKRMAEETPDKSKPAFIRVVVFEPGELPQVRDIPNNIAGLQATVQGMIECFPVGVEGLIGICNDDYLFNDSPVNRYIPALQSFIAGTFLVARDCAPDFGPVSAADVAQLLRALS